MEDRTLIRTGRSKASCIWRRGSDKAGGLTARGTARGIKVHRKDAAGAVQILEIKMNDPVERDDVIYVSESLF